MAILVKGLKSAAYVLRSGPRGPCVYILECGDGTLYTGWTIDIERRLKAHHAGKGARYTRSRLPVCLVYRELLDTRSAAMRREAAIKRLARAEKLEMILGQRKSSI